MKHIIKIVPVIIAIVTTLACFLPAATVRASQGAVYFNPGTGHYVVGDSFTVQVWVDVQQQTAIYHTSKGAVTFPSNLLQATRVVNANNGADFSPSVNQAGGTINFNTMLWGNLSPGFQAHVFDITFTVKNAGTATLGLSAGSIFFDGPTTVRQASYSLTIPPCPSGQVGTWPNCRTPTPAPTPSPKPTPTPTPTPSPKPTPTPAKPAPSGSSSTIKPNKPSQPIDESGGIPPENSSPLYDNNSNTGSLTINDPDNSDGLASNTFSIGNVKSSANYTSADISWLTNFGGEATFAYGTTKDVLNISSGVTLGEQKSYSTNLTNLKPGTLYYYQINATHNGEYTSYAGQFQTKGYPVVLTITQNNQPLTNATVTIGGDSAHYTTNDDGSITLNLSAGDHPVTIKTDTGSAEETINVKAVSIAAGKEPDTQNITIATTISAASARSGSSSMLAVGVILFILLILAAAGAFFFIRKRSAAANEPQAQTFDDTFWSAVPGASGVSEDIYGNPVYNTPMGTEQADPNLYPYPNEQQAVAPAYQSPSPDQYYQDQLAAQAPEMYGYTTQSEDATSYSYPAADPYAQPFTSSDPALQSTSTIDPNQPAEWQ